ncbi:MAG: triacylglycerol lipase [Oleispira sp.]|jgi:triacylglycerol lipase
MSKILLLSFVMASALLSQKAFSALDFLAIKTAAQLSAVSYVRPDLIDKRLPQLNYALVHYAELPDSAVSYYLAHTTSGLQQLAFRGTTNLENVLVNIDVQLQLNTNLGIQLHQGFSTAAKAAYENVLPYLDKSKPVQTTGHSLGGAIAVIVGMYLQRDGFQLDQIITFGQPKVTNVHGADVFKNLPLMRVVTANDIVPLVPPLSPLQLKSLDIYWHNGVEVILLGEKKYALVEGFKSMMRATKFVSALPSEKNLRAHEIGRYLALIESNQEGAQQMPYKLGFSLFGVTLD